MLLCDIALGDDSGHEVIRHIHAMLSGFQAHLVKPVDPRELTQTLLSVTRSFRA